MLPLRVDNPGQRTTYPGLPVNTADLIPTRQSLLSRLRDWNDQESWKAFFDTYWRLIYEVARKSGLNDAEAQDVVQETVLSVARQMPRFQYDRSRGRFKGWLLQITRRRIADLVRKRMQPGAQTSQILPGQQIVEQVADSGESSFELIWDEEWKRHVFETAAARVKQQVRPEHYQLFDLYVVQKWPVRKITATMGVNAGQVYLAKHRISSLMKKEITALEEAGAQVAAG